MKWQIWKHKLGWLLLGESRIYFVQDRAIKWKDQTRQWIKVYYKSRHTAPSDNHCNSKSVVNGFINERIPASPSVNVTAATTNGQVNTLNVFVKHKRSLQEEPAAYN